MQDQLFEDHGRPRYRGKRRSTETDKARWRAKTNLRHPCICRQCGSSFIGRYGQPFCGDTCKQESKSPREPKPQSCKVPWRTCKVCDQTFIGRSSFCDDCRAGAYLSQQREYNKRRPRTTRTSSIDHPWTAGYCQECEAPFVARHRNTAYCCRQCRDRAGRRIHKWRRTRRIRSGPREDIGLASLAKRDNWKCHYCRRRVSRKTWSMDHLIPLSDGGTHTWDNVALAHFMCNSLRGAHGPAQLRLQ